MDMQTTPRAQHFYYYSKMAKVRYSITVDIDITELYGEIKKKSLKFYPTYLYAATKIVNEMPALRTTTRNPQAVTDTPVTEKAPVGQWNYMTPSYAIFHDDDKTFSCMYTEYEEKFADFYTNYEKDNAEYGNVHGLLSKGVPPENSLMVSCLPWISFNNYSPTVFAGEDFYLPILESGKFYDRDGKKLMPFSISVHHAATDGYHVAQFLERFQALCADAANWV